MDLHNRLIRLARCLVDEAELLNLDPDDYGLRLERGPSGTWYILGLLFGPIELPKTNLAWNQKQAVQAAEVWLSPQLNLLDWADEVDEDEELTSPGCPTALKRSGTFRVSSDGYARVEDDEMFDDEPTQPAAPRAKLVGVS